MGNQMSVLQRVEDQENDSETDTPKVAAGSQCEQNGAPVMLSTHTIQYYSEVDLGISIQQDNVATSSSDTMELSAVEDANRENLGREANPEPPAAKSRFFLTLSRSVPGRAGDQATDSSRASVTPDVSSSEAAGNKGLSESRALPTAAAGRPAPDKTPGQAPAPDGGSSATWGPVPLSPESGGAAPSKPKDASIFDKIFKLDKGREKVPSDRRQEAESEECPDQADCIQGHPSHHVPAEADIVDSEGRGGQEIAALSDSLPGDPEELEAVKEDPQITNITENNPIMSFFKTLVSPNKAEAKKDLEDPGAEKPPATAADLKSDNVNFAPQDTQAAAKNPAATEIAKDGAKEKGAATPLPLAKMFWKKSVKEESVPTGSEENEVCESPVEVVKSQEAESALQTVDLNEDGHAPPKPAESKSKREEGKPQKTSILAFFRQMSVKGDEGLTHTEDINGKDSNYQTSNSTEKATTPPEPEPPVATPKGKESSSKDKKAAAEVNKQKNNKQEAKEAAQCELAVVEVNSLQNGDKALKRPERQRQSLGGFLKGLGPKRMSDAQVQTDPVSIGPAGKSK
ncbi:breast carcinoma-amplified sequence 1 isoform X1 [Talpa occidentalis]|uniref:breast carcinoma-amplified sequence 1 isoform X1 n=1 Tax=Talpa occidentalis TaxID=50954 RepID=UPI00188E4C16|nr:breast carcinoma-amplified sequence 1 isoform X1 [Talpa occidentalis]